MQHIPQGAISLLVLPDKSQGGYEVAISCYRISLDTAVNQLMEERQSKRVG